MKTLLRNTVILATCIISGVVFSGAIPPDCPFPQPEGESTLFPYKGDCSKYWKCSNGIAYEMQCPAGLHFNDQYKFCDWAEDAGCEKEKSEIKLTETYERELRRTCIRFQVDLVEVEKIVEVTCLGTGYLDCTRSYSADTDYKDELCKHI